MRNIFGWSYPPGAANDPNAPYNQTDDGPCDVCGQGLDECICPECPVCENVGDVTCYENHHGMIRSFAQVALRAEFERLQEEQDAADALYYDQLIEEEKLAGEYWKGKGR